MKTSSEFRAQARAALSEKWGEAAVFTLVYCVISIGLSALLGAIVPIVGSLIGSLAIVPITFAYTVAFLGLFRGGHLDIADMFKQFNNRVFITMILVSIYTWLWTLLFIIPGIVKIYSYAMTPYLLNDNEELTGDEAINASMRMMNGHKWELFVLDLTFIGWWILCIFTLGIGYLWLNPYMQTSRAAFYEELKSASVEQSNYAK